MKSIFCAALVFALVAPFVPTVAFADMQDDVNQAVTIFQRFQDIPEQSVPRSVLKDARGIAILTVLKAGFIFSGRGGHGVVVARTRKGWSGPSAIGTGGAGFGLQIGAQVTEFVMILNTAEAVNAFSREGNIQLGTDLSVAAGPVGRTAAVGITPMAAVYTYSRSQGIFAGISLEGTVVVTRKDANAAYYGRSVVAGDILAGRIKPPAGARRLVQVLSRY